MELRFLEFYRPLKYLEGIQIMKEVYDYVFYNKQPNTIIILEHTPVITRGASAKDAELISPTIPVVTTDRGGKFTYHAPGQLVCYPIINLKTFNFDVRTFVLMLESVILETLREYKVNGFLKKNLIGVWVNDGNSEKKIAAIGIKLKKFISTHGFAINYALDMSHFNEIIPCGIKEYGVTSLQELGIKTNHGEISAIVKDKFQKKLQTI